MARKSQYIPRPAELAVRVHGARILRLKMTSEQADRFARGVKWAREIWKRNEGKPLHDEDLMDALIASLHHDFGA